MNLKEKLTWMVMSCLSIFLVYVLGFAIDTLVRSPVGLPDLEPSQSSVLTGLGISTCGCIAPEMILVLGDVAAEEIARREYWQRRCYNSLELCQELEFEEWWRGVSNER